MRAQKCVLLLILNSQVFGGVFDPEWAVAQAIGQMVDKLLEENEFSTVFFCKWWFLTCSVLKRE